MFAARAMSKAAAPARAAASRAAVAAPQRGMAGGAAPKYTGWEAKVREKLPKDEHVSGVSYVAHVESRQVAPEGAEHLRVDVWAKCPIVLQAFGFGREAFSTHQSHSNRRALCFGSLRFASPRS